MDIDLIWVEREAEFFLKRDWTEGKSLDGAVSTARLVAAPELEGTAVEAPFRFVGTVEPCPLFKPKLTSL
jgi:hypothetical protein